MTNVNPDVVTLTVPESLAGDVSAVEASYAMTDSRQSAEQFALDTKIYRRCYDYGASYPTGPLSNFAATTEEP